MLSRPLRHRIAVLWIASYRGVGAGKQWPFLGRSMAVALVLICILAGASAVDPREEVEFGSNPGNLRMYSYAPTSLAPSAPLIVICTAASRTR